MQMNRRTAVAALISSLVSFRTTASGAGGAEPHGEKNGTTNPYTVRQFTAPFYPVMARQASIEGKLTAIVHISRNGRVASVTDVKGHPLFQGAVSEVLKEWRFDPLNNEDGQMEITFAFVLKGDSGQGITTYKVSGVLPNYMEIAVNPVGANP